MTEQEKINKIIDWILPIPFSKWKKDSGDSRIFRCEFKGVDITIGKAINSRAFVGIDGEMFYENELDAKLTQLIDELLDYLKFEKEGQRKSVIDNILNIIESK